MTLIPEIEVEAADDQFNIDLVAAGYGCLYLGEVKTAGRYLANKECSRYRHRMNTLAKLISPVHITVVHAWTGDLASKAEHLESSSYPTRYVRLPRRAWYSA